jgi:hypothetical protein
VLNQKTVEQFEGHIMPACDRLIRGKSGRPFVAVVTAFVVALLIFGASTHTAKAACSSEVKGGLPVLYNKASDIAGYAIAFDCGDLTKITVTLWWGHIAPGMGRLGISTDPRVVKTFATPGRGPRSFSTGKVDCRPGVYMVQVKGYNGSGKVVAQHKSKKLSTRCNA